MARKPSSIIHTPEGIGCYVNLFTPRARKGKDGQPKGDPKYSIALVFEDPAELKAMKAAAQAKGVEKFGPKFVDMVKKGKVNWPFADNDDRDDDDRDPPFDIKGSVTVNFKTGDKPGIVDADAEPIMEKSEVYSGMRCRVSCRPFAYDNESKGVAFALVNVQKLGDGDRLAGNPSAEDDFTPVKGKSKPSRKSTEADGDDLL